MATCNANGYKRYYFADHLGTASLVCQNGAVMRQAALSSGQLRWESGVWVCAALPGRVGDDYLSFQSPSTLLLYTNFGEDPVSPYIGTKGWGIIPLHWHISMENENEY